MLALTNRAADVLAELAKQVELPADTLTLAQNSETSWLAPELTLAEQGVEPYTLLLLLASGVDTLAHNDSGAAAAPVQRRQPTLTQELTQEHSVAVAASAAAPAADEPLANIWEEPNTAKYIVVEGGEVTSATLNKIIERITSIDTIDLQLTQAFLCTYKSFTTAEETWQKLMERCAFCDTLTRVCWICFVRLTAGTQL